MNSKHTMDISNKHVVGKCDQKCNYSFKYSESNSTAKNHGVMLSLSYEQSAPPVIYNGEKYNVASLMLVSPSLHWFNGKSMPAELIVEHTPVAGGNNLHVCVPFEQSVDSSTASATITRAIQKVASNAPGDGDSTDLKMPSLNLQDIVPRKPYYAYSVGATDYIVFGALDAIPLSGDTLATLKKLIKPFSLDMPHASLFYNAKGPISGVSIGDGLYISCQPTGGSEEETPVAYEKTSSSSEDASQLLMWFLFAVLGGLLFLLIFYGISLFYSAMTDDVPFFNRSS